MSFPRKRKSRLLNLLKGTTARMPAFAGMAHYETVCRGRGNPGVLDEDESQPLRLTSFCGTIFFQEVLLRKVFGIFLLVLLSAVAGWAQAPDAGPGKDLSIVFSANVLGEVEPCG